MIVFHCPGCDNKLRVADDRAGTQGRCPSCKAVIDVPDLPARRRPASRPRPRNVKDPKLRELHEHLVQRSNVPITRHRVMGPNDLALEIATNEDKSRNQGVSVFLFDDDDLGQCLCIVSQIGQIKDSKQDENILRAAHFMVGARVSISPDSIGLVLIERKLATCGKVEFAKLVHDVAVYADRLEAGLFEWDAF